MKLTAALMLAGCLQVSAGTFGQRVTLSLTNVPLKKVLVEIQKQTGLNALVDEKLLTNAGNVTLDVRNMPVNQVVDICLRNEPFTYTIEAGAIILKAKSGDLRPEPPAVTVMPVAVLPVHVHGKVTNEKGEPAAGVTVEVKGTKIAVATDDNGEFSISDVPSGATLVFSSANMVTYETKLNGRSEVVLSMKAKVSNMDEIMVSVGYGSQKKASLTAAVSTVNVSEMVDIPAATLSNALQGRASGTYVQTPSGLPGTTSTVRIRANSSWNGGTPLFVIDGVVRDQATFDLLDPSQIDNFSILKDAASAAIYGSRSSNGVILVTTKSGRKGAPVVELNSVFTLSSKPENQFEYLSIDQAIALYNQTNPTSHINAFDEAWIHKNNPDGKMYFDAAYTKPFSEKHSLTVSGGGDNVTYFFGGVFFDEKGFLPQVSYKKYDLRGSVRASVTKDLTLSLNLNANNGVTHRFYSALASDADLSGFYEKLFYLGGATTPPYINGLPVYPGWAGGNAIEDMRNGGYIRTSDQRLDALVSAEYKVPFIKGLTAKVSYSNNGDYNLKKTFATKPLLYNFAKDPRSTIGVLTDSVIGTTPNGFPSEPFIGNDDITVSSYQLNGSLTYDRSFGAHHLNVLAAYEQYESTGTYSSLYKYNFPVATVDQFAFASQAPGDTKSSGYEIQDARLSYIGRVNYDYGGKYLLSASAREDGSIKFAPNKRWGLFPSGSAGWVISKEDFFANSKAAKAIDMLKVRFSYGTTGNDAIGGWMWQELYNASDSGFYLGSPGAPAPMLLYNGLSNPNLTWETSTASDLGLDLRLLSHWTVTAELWRKHSYNILGQRVLALPIEFGASFPAVNYGVVNAKGFEFELGYTNGRIGRDITFDARANFSLATTDVITKDYAANSLPAQDPEGKPLDYLVGYKATGIIRTQAELNALPAGATIFGAQPGLGMMNFQDVSGPNGKPDGVINEYDQVVIAKHGSAAGAPVAYGLNFNISYKGFTISTLFSGLAGYKLLYNDPWGRNFPGGLNVPKIEGNSWSPSNPNGTFPELYPSGDARANGYVVPSTFNTFSGNFFRLKSLNLFYEIPSPLMSRVGIKSFQVFAGGTNLFVLRKFKYYDPEISTYASYPNMSNITAGINVRF